MATWRVNSYSYPNPFDGRHGLNAWRIFETFQGHGSYKAVKTALGNRLSAHAVESWKADFEELGLLYVLTREDEVHVTDGGRQLLEAAAAADEREFAWVGLNLLLRYPLRGTAGRRTRGDDFGSSDLLLYWFVLAAALELDGFWETELNRVLAITFATSSATHAIEAIRRLRAGEASVGALPDPVSAGGAYNAINQVVVKAGLNHMIFTSTRVEGRYSPELRENLWRVVPKYRDLVELALGGQGVSYPAGCAGSATLIERMPPAAVPVDEQGYFEYLGAAVTPLDRAEKDALTGAVQVTNYGGEIVYLLSSHQFKRIDWSWVQGNIHVLCVLAPGQRVILDDDLAHTHIVEGKNLSSDGTVIVKFRRARSIVDSAYVASLFDGGADA